MATMSMNKAIHGAVRRDLDRFLGALGSFSDGDSRRAARLGKAWDNLDDQLTRHHEGEHEIAWPALASIGVPQALLDTFDQEHDALAAALSSTREVMTRFRSSATVADATAARAAFEHLKTVAGSHLDHEEAEIEPIFQQHKDSPEMKAMGRRFGKVSPSVGGTFFAWVLDGASPEERAAITESVPGPVLAIIGGIFGRGYRRDVATVWQQ
jgi:hemerythrin-like domain-containing protein